jgi:hypothetical protein
MAYQSQSQTKEEKMDTNKILRIMLLLLMVSTMLLTACGGGDTGSPTTSTENTSSSNSSSSSENTKPAASEATPEPQDIIPENLIVHPDAFDFEITEATNTYVYYVPMMVAETLEYLEAEMEPLGWEALGKPTLMGHLATLNLQQEGYRLNISLQDNEHSMTTRVQMLLNEQ